MVEDASEAFKASPDEIKRSNHCYPAPLIERWPIRVRVIVLITGAALSWALVYAIARLLL